MRHEVSQGTREGELPRGGFLTLVYRAKEIYGTRTFAVETRAAISILLIVPENLSILLRIGGGLVCIAWFSAADGASDAFAFFNRVDAIDCGDPQLLLFAVGPTNLGDSRVGGIAEAEVHAAIIR